MAHLKSAVDENQHASTKTAAVVFIGVLWLVYTFLQGAYQLGKISPPASAVLDLLPGLLAIALLLRSDFTRQDLFITAGPLSGRGLISLLLSLPIMLPIYLTGSFAGWVWTGLLIYAPLGAIAQVLFFRCAVLPLCLRLLPNRPVMAIVLAALIHGLWHVGPLVQGQPMPVPLLIMLVPFLVSILWNWQIRRDGTVVWSAGLHILVDQGIVLLYGG